MSLCNGYDARLSQMLANAPWQKIVEHATETDRAWKYYDYGPKSIKCPLVLFPQVSGTAETYFRQIMALGSQNYRVISVRSTHSLRVRI